MSLRLTLDHLLELHPGKLLGREEQDRGCNEAEEGELPVIPKLGLGADFLSREKSTRTESVLASKTVYRCLWH